MRTSWKADDGVFESRNSWSKFNTTYDILVDEGCRETEFEIGIPGEIREVQSSPLKNDVRTYGANL